MCGPLVRPLAPLLVVVLWAGGTAATGAALGTDVARGIVEGPPPGSLAGQRSTLGFLEPQTPGPLAKERVEPWQTWEAGRRANGPLRFGTALLRSPEGAAASAARGEAGIVEAIDGFGTRAVWSLEGYGFPLDMLPTGEAHAYLVVTSAGLLRFPAGADRDPEWAVKLRRGVTEWQSGDANGDGVRDAFLTTTRAFMEQGEPTFYVVDGLTGRALLQARPPPGHLLAWTTTDVDRDGRDDVLGVTADAQLVAFGATGRPLHETGIEDSLGLAGQDPTDALGRVAALAWGDVDADGTQDAVVAYHHRLNLPVASPFGTLGAVAEASVGIVAARSGRDGRVLWKTDARPLEDFDGPFGLRAGDLNGDGRDDAVLWGDDVSALRTFSPMGESAAEVRTEFVEAFDGADGSLLMRDVTTGPWVKPLEAGVDASSQAGYVVRFVEDVDADGRAEILTTRPNEAGDGPLSLTFQARGLGPERGGPSAALYEWRLSVPGFHQWQVQVRAVDLGDDGHRGLVAHIVALQRDAEGNPAALKTQVAVLDRRGPQAPIEPPENLAFWSYAAGGRQAYGYVVERDRWMALGPQGGLEGEGVRFEAFLNVLYRHDENGDGTEDLLVAGLSTVRWVNGRTGATVEETRRPPLRWNQGSLLEGGRVRLLELDTSTGDLVLVDLHNQIDLWRITQGEREEALLLQLHDANADGRVDALVRSVEDKRLVYRVQDPRTKAMLWQSDGNVTAAALMDVLPERAGSELVLQKKGQEGPTLSLHAVGAERSAWETETISNFVSWGGGEGGLHYRSSAGGKTRLHSLDPATGLERFSYPLSDDEERSLDHAFLPLRGEGPRDLVNVRATRDLERQRLEVHSGVDGERLGAFDLGPPLRRQYVSIIGEPVAHTLWAHVSGAPGDWNRNGRPDVVLREGGRVTVRDVGTGDLVARVAGRSGLTTLIDVNQDGAKELVVALASERLVVLAFDVRAKGEPGGHALEHVVDPADPKLDPLPIKAGRTPSLGALAPLGLLGLGTFLRRRASCYS